MAGRTLDWKDELGRWLKPFLDRLGHKARRQMCPLYVSGLIGPGDRKSIQPMAERLALGEYDQLHHFIAAGVWDAAPVETELLVQADQARRRQRCRAGDRRHRDSEEGQAFGGCRSAICFGAGQDRQLPDAGVADACARRSAGHAGLAAVSSRELDEQSGSAGASGCSGRISNGADEAGDGSGGDRSCHRGRCALWLCAGGCGLWDERAVPPGAHGSQTCLGGRYSASPQGVPCRCADDLAGCWCAAVPVSGTFQTFYRWRPKTCWPMPMAEHQLAHRHERKAQGSLCRRPCAHRRRTTAADQGQGPATSARGGGLAHRRTQDVGREEILSRQPAGEDGPAHLGGHHQGAMDLRAGSPAAERRTRPRSLRGTILARPSPSCAHDDDRLRLPPVSPPCNSKAGKKESTGHRLSQLCQPCATPSSNLMLDRRRSDVRTAENGFATSSGVSKSAKVVLEHDPLKWTPVFGKKIMLHRIT